MMHGLIVAIKVWYFGVVGGDCGFIGLSDDDDPENVGHHHDCGGAAGRLSLATKNTKYKNLIIKRLHDTTRHSNAAYTHALLGSYGSENALHIISLPSFNQLKQRAYPEWKGTCTVANQPNIRFTRTTVQHNNALTSTPPTRNIRYMHERRKTSATW